MAEHWPCLPLPSREQQRPEDLEYAIDVIHCRDQETLGPRAELRGRANEAKLVGYLQGSNSLSRRDTWQSTTMRLACMAAHTWKIRWSGSVHSHMDQTSLA